MTNYSTNLKDWGASGSVYPDGYSYTKDGKPVDAWDNFVINNTVNDLSHLISLTNERLDSTRSDSTALPAGPGAGELAWQSDTQRLGVYDDVAASWKDLTYKGEFDSHEHDDRYYTESETDSLLSGKSDTSHAHAHSEITSVGASDHHTRYADSEAVSAVNAETSLSVDVTGDADTVDGFHAADLGVDIEEDGAVLVSNATAVDFAGHLNVTDELDGTVTVDPSHNHDGRYYTEAEADSNFSASGHTHDGRYYTETETDNLLSGKSDTTHSHALGDLSNVTATGEGSGNGFDADTVDGSHASSFASSGHSHAHSDLTSVGSGDHHTRYADSEAVSAVNAEASLSVDVTGDADTVDGNHADDLTRQRYYASLTSTNTSLNINQSSWTQIPWNSQKNVDAGYSHSTSTNPEQITFDEAGTYQVYASLGYYSGSARVNPGIKFAINGSRRDATGLSGYVRAASGHNEGSNSLMETITVNAGDTLTVQTYQYGNNGTTTMRASESALEIMSVGTRVQMSSDADTVDGKHAADFVHDSGDTMTGNLRIDKNTPRFYLTDTSRANNEALRVESNGGQARFVPQDTSGALWTQRIHYDFGNSEWVSRANLRTESMFTSDGEINAGEGIKVSGSSNHSYNGVKANSGTGNGHLMLDSNGGNLYLNWQDGGDVRVEGPMSVNGGISGVNLGDLDNVSASGEGSGNNFDADTVDGQHASELGATTEDKILSSESFAPEYY